LRGQRQITQRPLRLHVKRYKEEVDMDKSIILGVLLGVFLYTPVLADSCEMRGATIEAVTVRGNAAGKVANGDRGYQLSSRELCFDGRRFSVRDVRFKSADGGVQSRACNAQVADAKAYSGGSARGNGC
jgi:hypothetical protein